MSGKLVDDLFIEFGYDSLRFVEGINELVAASTRSIEEEVARQVRAIDFGYVNVYHATLAKNVDSILKTGLTGDGAATLVSTSEETAWRMALSRPDVRKAIALGVDPGEVAVVRFALPRADAAKLQVDGRVLPGAFALPKLPAKMVREVRVSQAVAATSELEPATIFFRPERAISKSKLAAIKGLAVREAYQRLAFEVGRSLTDAAVLNRWFASEVVASAAKGQDVRRPLVIVVRERAEAIFGRPAAEYWKLAEDAAADRFVKTVLDGLRAGKTLASIEKEVREQMGIAARNAKALVRSSVAAIATSERMAEFRKHSDFVSGVQQISTLDSRTSDICIAYDHAEWNLDGSPINGTTLPFNGGPPRHWNSVAEGTLIATSRGEVPIESVRVGDSVLTHRGRFRRVTATMRKVNEKGVIRVFHTDSGRMLRATDEHPVLAFGRGWVRADSIRRGDKLFENGAEPSPQRGALVEVRATDDYPPCFDESEVFPPVGVFSERVPTPVYFNDHSVIRKSEVANVFAEDELPFVRNSAFAQYLGKLFFAFRRVFELFGCDSDCAREVGSLRQAGVVARHPEGVGRVCGVCFFAVPKAPMIFASERAATVESGQEFARGLALALDGDSVVLASDVEPSLGDAEFALNSTDALAVSKVLALNQFAHRDGVLQIDHWRLARVVGVEIVQHHGEVFNLAVDEDETYVADGVVVHNCRSTLVPITGVVKGLPTGKRASEHGPVDARLNFEQWLKTKDEAYQNKVLGKPKADLWRAGKLKLRDLLDVNGDPLKASEIYAKYGVDFGWLNSAQYQLNRPTQYNGISSNEFIEIARQHGVRLDDAVVDSAAITFDYAEVVVKTLRDAQVELDSMSLSGIKRVVIRAAVGGPAGYYDSNNNEIGLFPSMALFSESDYYEKFGRLENLVFAFPVGSPDRLRAVIWHEVGHVVHRAISAESGREILDAIRSGRGNEIDAETFQALRGDVSSPIPLWMGMASDFKPTSLYGQRTYGEYWAEAYAAIKMGREDLVDEFARSEYFLLQQLRDKAP